jgi:hypothetical protein
MMRDPYIEFLKEDIETRKAILEMLKSGKMYIGERQPNEPGRDRTQAQIDDLERTIAMHQTTVRYAQLREERALTRLGEPSRRPARPHD